MINYNFNKCGCLLNVILYYSKILILVYLLSEKKSIFIWLGKYTFENVVVYTLV